MLHVAMADLVNKDQAKGDQATVDPQQVVIY